jgi:hypothetical protein
MIGQLWIGKYVEERKGHYHIWKCYPGAYWEQPYITSVMRASQLDKTVTQTSRMWFSTTHATTVLSREKKLSYLFCLYRMLGPNVVVCNSLDSALQRLQGPPLAGTIESAWVIGGSSVYRVCNYFPLLRVTQCYYSSGGHQCVWFVVLQLWAG